MKGKYEKAQRVRERESEKKGEREGREIKQE
jgi:hypothetical protein